MRNSINKFDGKTNEQIFCYQWVKGMNSLVVVLLTFDEQMNTVKISWFRGKEKCQM